MTWLLLVSVPRPLALQALPVLAPAVVVDAAAAAATCRRLRELHTSKHPRAAAVLAPSFLRVTTSRLSDRDASAVRCPAAASSRKRRICMASTALQLPFCQLYRTRPLDLCRTINVNHVKTPSCRSSATLRPACIPLSNPPSAPCTAPL